MFSLPPFLEPYRPEMEMGNPEIENTDAGLNPMVRDLGYYPMQCNTCGSELVNVSQSFVYRSRR
jgi:hypothetical protein